MGKTSFQNLQKLIREIDAKIAAVKSGNLPISDLEELVKLATDLHERLAVLRYKAYEKFGEPAIATQATSSVEIKDEQPSLEEKHFDISFTEEKIEKIDVTPVHFDLTETSFETKPKEVEIPVAKEELQKPIHVIREESKPDASSLHEKFLKEDDVDLNDVLKKDDDLPLRKKLGLKPIKDLRTEIGIGKKFEYINMLFAGDNKAYDTAINELNNCSDADAAKQKLNVYASVYRWNLEEKTIIKFVELVERRFL